MLLDQRRRHVLELIEEKGFISLHELATKTGVSESTLRRDLEYLDGIRQVRRTRGGAAYVGESVVSLEERSVTSLVEKQRIARSISETIGSGETVLLDGGTTTLEVARALIGKELQVVTNSLAIANLLVNSPGVELIFFRRVSASQNRCDFRPTPEFGVIAVAGSSHGFQCRWRDGERLV